jgi:DNA-binding MarR family transcriptional regulator
MVAINLEEIQARDNRLYSRILLSRVRDLMLDVREIELAPIDITPRQAYILLILYHLGHKATLSQLTKYNERQASTISVQMTKMEKAGLVRKVRKTTKSTLLIFEMTTKGLDTYYKSEKQTSEKVIMSALSEKERLQFIASLKKILNKAAKYHKARLDAEG